MIAIIIPQAVRSRGGTVIGTVLNQRFSLEKELGRGGMGAVYRANDLLLERSVAIKVLKDLSGPEVSKKIRLEAQILARLLHENVVRLYDFGIADGTYFLVMEEVDGSSFQKRWKKITLSERLRILAQVSDALDYAHHQGVIHRDVKPANILLTGTDQAKLSDFGLSLLADDSHESGVTRGTPNYMSPEQAKGKRLDHRSDLYALGVIMYECATGSLPFQGSMQAVMSKHVREPPTRPRVKSPEVSEALEALILNLLAKNPAERPASGQAVARALRGLLDGSRGLEPTLRVADLASPAVALDRLEPATVVMTAPEPATSIATFSTTLPDAAPELARKLIEEVETDPIVLTADERYLTGHYLAYLLGGARRRGLFQLRPVDALNANRARLLLAMTSIMLNDASELSIERAADLLEQRPEVRPALSPIVVVKYLASRATDSKVKRFRQARRRLKEASPYARATMLDKRAVLNPGLMPQNLDDLRRIAPVRTEVDDQLVLRWNSIAEAWRGDFGFRMAVLRYATCNAHRDPASFTMWPEVVYPLIERARWQRQRRSRLETIWDALCGNLHIPDAGLRLDKAINQAVSEQVAQHLDLSLDEFVEDPKLADDLALAQEPESEGLSIGAGLSAVSLEELASEGPVTARGVVRLTSSDPIRLTLGELGTLWKEALNALRASGSRVAHRHVPIGPYRLAVIPSIRSHSAGNVAIQGMPNKQVEMLTPSLRGGATSKPIIAVWLYQNNSLVIAYVDFKNHNRYIAWDASTSQQTNFDDAATLNHNLLQIGLEAPDQLSVALSKGFRPRNPV